MEAKRRPRRTPPQPRSFADRRAERTNLDLAALVEPMFESADVDHSGTIGFLELLRVLRCTLARTPTTLRKQGCPNPRP